MAYTFEQARVVAVIQAACLSWPANIHPVEMKYYTNTMHEIIFNESHRGNLDYVEQLKNSNHRIINDCWMRPGFYEAAI